MVLLAWRWEKRFAFVFFSDCLLALLRRERLGVFARLFPNHPQLSPQRFFQRDFLRASHGDVRVPRLRFHGKSELRQFLDLVSVRAFRGAARHARFGVPPIKRVNLNRDFRFQQQLLGFAHQVARGFDISIHRPYFGDRVRQRRQRRVRFTPRLSVPSKRGG